MLKKYLSKIYYSYFYSSPIGYRIRQKFRNNCLAEIKPYSKASVISDLFVWRLHQDWKTYFQLFNISSFLFPELSPSEECELHFFSKEGKLLKVINMKLDPFACQHMDISLVDGLVGEIGTFCIFHFSDVMPKINEKQAHLTERGYISYKYGHDVLESYCHGNLQAVSKKKGGSIKSVVGTSSQETSYTLQMIFSDVSKFELLYTNPSFKHQTVRVVFFDENHQIIKEIKRDIKPLGVEVILVENSRNEIHTLQNFGHIVMWRPLVKKFYKSHFDVLHG